MFERFTDRARRVVVLAQEEARSLNHNYIGTEHLLLGLLNEEQGIAAQVLVAQGASLARVRELVTEIIGEGTQSPVGYLPFTPRAKRVMEMSLREALRLGHNYIGTEHFLLALIREGDGVAAQILAAEGIRPEVTTQLVIEQAGAGSAEGAPRKRASGRPTTASAPWAMPAEPWRSPATCLHPDPGLVTAQHERGYSTVRCGACGRLVGVLPND